MPAIPFRPAPPSWRNPSAAWRTGIALTVLAIIIGLRIWTAVGLPTYVWTRDSGSYVAPATAWLDAGQWVTSARRGPVYSLFLAATFRAGGTLATAANVQAVIGALTTVLTLLLARTWLGRRAFWPLMFCALFYVLYGVPIELERLIRNETLLMLFATVAFGAWFVALRTGKARWFALSGIATGLMQLLKGIFPIFPLLVLALTAWVWRRQPMRLARLAGCYLVLFLLPLIGSKMYDRLSGTTRPAEPEAGEMFYGRTAQWTVLGGGIVPDIKARIHDQAAAYADRFRRTGHLDNNEIVKRTVVPTLKTVLVDERHKQPADVDRLCWRLGLEAVEHHPGAYLRQVVHDFYTLNFITAQRFVIFFPPRATTGHDDSRLPALQAAARDAAEFSSLHPEQNKTTTVRVFDLAASRAAIHAAARDGSGLHRLSRFVTVLGRLRFLSPAFLTSLLLPTLIYCSRARERLFWLGNTVLWYYYLVLLSTVGRPLDRYLMPVVPIMFWAISTAAAMGWRWWFSGGRLIAVGWVARLRRAVGIEGRQRRQGTANLRLHPQ